MHQALVSCRLRPIDDGTVFIFMPGGYTNTRGAAVVGCRLYATAYLCVSSRVSQSVLLGRTSRAAVPARGPKRADLGDRSNKSRSAEGSDAV